METNGHKKDCEFATEIVAYMYDELPANGRTAFERHLSACQACTDEFAGVSQARFEVFEWRHEEFDTLATPQIVVPYPEKSESLIARLSAMLSWTTVVPAAAAILIMLGLGYVIWTRSGPANDQVGEQNDSVKAPVIATPSPGPEIVNTTGNDTVRSDVNSTQPQQVAIERTRSLHKSFVAKRAPTVKLGNDVAVNVPSRTKPVPRLSVYDDDDDTSLRLSDLFEETGPPRN